MPIMSSGTEQSKASKIITGFSVLMSGVNASNYATENDFTGVSVANVTNHLPANYNNRAANGQNYSVTVNTNPTKYNASLNIPDDRLRARVKAAYNSSQYSESGTTITLVGP